jgi:hypothetical protein
MTDSAPAPQRRSRRIALSLLGALALIAGGRLLSGIVGPGADGGAVLERTWDSTAVLGLTMASPGRFRPITVPVPAEVRTSIESIESWGRNAGETEMRVSRTEYLAGVPLSLEGSAQGAVDAMRNNPAVAGMTHSHAPAQVSGIPAVHTTSTFQVTGRPAHGEILTVLRGRTIWQVQVLGPQDEAPGIARRLMESVRLQP